jgi:hypothetical protein
LQTVPKTTTMMLMMTTMAGEVEVLEIEELASS